MSKTKTTGKLELNKETVKDLVDLSKVQGAVGDDPGFIAVSRNKAKSISAFLCCCEVK